MSLQASRRLARTINQHLVSRKHGYVSLAAQTYIYLLDRLQPSDSSLLAKELILEHVVRIPLQHPGLQHPSGSSCNTGLLLLKQSRHRHTNRTHLATPATLLQLLSK